MRKAITTSLIVLLVAAMLVTAGCLSTSIGARDKVAVISLSGTITSGGGSFLFGSVITPSLVREQLQKAQNDDAVKAVVLRVESPGGGVVASQEITKEIVEFKQAKPVVVSMGTMAASGGYHISAKADKIVALQGTQTGSIGVIAQIPNVEGLYEKLGIKMQVFKAGKYKDMYAGVRDLTPEEEEIMQNMIDEYYEQFVTVVTEGRGLSKEQVRSLATGQLYTGTEAEKLGLVDELGDLDTAIDLAAELAGVESPKVEYYQPPKLSLRSLLGFADVMQLRLLGLGAQDIMLLETLSHVYPEPQYLYLG